MRRWVLKSQHVNPWEAVEIHKDIRAKHSIGIHWGTFPLTQEVSWLDILVSLLYSCHDSSNFAF